MLITAAVPLRISLICLTLDRPVLNDQFGSQILPLTVILARTVVAPARLESKTSAMRMELPVGRHPATGRSWPEAAGINGPRLAAVGRTLSRPATAFVENCAPRLPAMNCG